MPAMTLKVRSTAMTSCMVSLMLLLGGHYAWAVPITTQVGDKAPPTSLAVVSRTITAKPITVAVPKSQPQAGGSTSVAFSSQSPVTASNPLDHVHHAQQASQSKPMSTAKTLTQVAKIPTVIRSSKGIDAKTQDSVIHSMVTLSVRNGDTATVKLSTLSINRLLVAHDQINTIICPVNKLGQRACSMHGASQRLSAGVAVSVAGGTRSAYLSINPDQSQPFTAQVTTVAHRYFTLLIIPQKMPAVTVLFKPLSAGIGIPKLPEGASYTTGLALLMKQLMTHKRINGWGYTKLHATSGIRLNAYLVMIPIAKWQGSTLRAMAYQLTNVGKRSVGFSERLFYHAHIKAVALSTDYLKPHQSGLVYLIADRSAS